METGHDVKFEEISKEVLAETLQKFYPSARQKPTKDYTKGKALCKKITNQHSVLH